MVATRYSVFPVLIWPRQGIWQYCLDKRYDTMQGVVKRQEEERWKLGVSRCRPTLLDVTGGVSTLPGLLLRAGPGAEPGAGLGPEGVVTLGLRRVPMSR